MSWLWREYPTPQHGQTMSRGAPPARGPLGPESGVAQLIRDAWSRTRLYPTYSDTYVLQGAPTGWPVPESGAQGLARVPFRFSGPSSGAVTVRGGRLYRSGPGIPPESGAGSAPPAMDINCEDCWTTYMAPETLEAWHSSGCNACGQFPGAPSYGPAAPPPVSSQPAPSAGAPAPVSPTGFDCDFCMDMWSPECDVSPCAEHLEAATAEHTAWDTLKEDLGLEDWADWLLEPDPVPDDDAPDGSKSKKAADERKKGTTLPVGAALLSVSRAPSVLRPEYVAIGVGGLAVALGGWWLWSRRG